jgi:hypothetical protein
LTLLAKLCVHKKIQAIIGPLPTRPLVAVSAPRLPASLCVMVSAVLRDASLLLVYIAEYKCRYFFKRSEIASPPCQVGCGVRVGRLIFDLVNSTLQYQEFTGIVSAGAYRITWQNAKSSLYNVISDDYIL